jgi:hypothetical protein
VSREEAFQRLADISNAMRQMDIDLGVQQERERIIRLLEEYKCPCYCEVHIVLDPVIALIKGENK